MAADWSAFYTALCAEAGSVLRGLDDEAREAIAAAASVSDVFWSASLADTFDDLTAESTRGGVEAALEVWLENVVEAFGDLLDIDRAAVTIDPAAVDRLTAVADGTGN